MKAISLWQPWASLWLTDKKIHETRHWPTSFRGWIIVHAAKHPINKRDFVDDPLGEICHDEFGSDWKTSLPFGAIIGAVDLTDCRLMKLTSPEHQDDMWCGNWSDERYAWRRSSVVKLDEPIPYRGRQSLFDIPNSDIEAIVRMIANEESAMA